VAADALIEVKDHRNLSSDVHVYFSFVPMASSL
jgi:hypothetical protein